MQKCNCIILLKNEKKNPEHDYINVQMAAYTIIFLKHLIAYYCKTTSHTLTRDKIALWKINFVYWDNQFSPTKADMALRIAKQNTI